MTASRGRFGLALRPAARICILAVAAVLGGCISIFPKEKPAQLYRFGATAAISAPTQTVGERGRGVLVRASISGFDRASAGDRILTADGDKTAYVASARWVEPATNLLDEALHAAFSQSTPASLLGRGDLAAADARLSLDVETFEVVYRGGPGATPTVVVRIDADLEGAKAPFQHTERLFEADTPAQSNTVGGIVQAYDGAVGQVLGQIVAWVNAGATKG